ncbi:MAG TPA: AAA family ATPase [bacterium]|nr:AAA family ATPase [bacterium]
MIEKFYICGFKSIEDLEFEPGAVNVLVGANGSGKSNLLEAIGVLSAAARGRVDDEALLRRGVRPGVPALYKSSFSGGLQPKQITFEAQNSQASYAVSLHNPLKDPLPAWKYKNESLQQGGKKIVGRGPRDVHKYSPTEGLAAARAAELAPKYPAAYNFLNELQEFAIYCPDTLTLRGLVPDPQTRAPIGLVGGQLAIAVSDALTSKKKRSDWGRKVKRQALALIDWAKSYGTAPAASMPLSSSVASTQRVIRFEDRFMKSPRNVLSGYDASEGALYVLFHAVLAAHPLTPPIYAVDNADHALNPRLARELLKHICLWNAKSPHPRQIFLTTQNPLALDGLPLQDEMVRLFTVSRTEKGRTTIRRIILDKKLQQMARQGWTLSRLWVKGHLGGVPNV